MVGMETEKWEALYSKDLFYLAATRRQRLANISRKYLGETDFVALFSSASTKVEMGSVFLVAKCKRPSSRLNIRAKIGITGIRENKWRKI